jgi:hypothetical protein
MGYGAPTQDELNRFRELSKTLTHADGTPNYTQIAKQLGRPRTTVLAWPRFAEGTKTEFPETVLSEENEPIDEILGRLRKAHTRKQKQIEARTWFPIKVKEDKPYGILWFGDPHLGQHCNWDLLDRDIAIAQRDGVYGGNIGDTTDNWPWTGRMARLWAEVDVSSPTEKRLANWFMFETGIKWMVWLLGNHDEWNGGSEFYKMLGAHQIPVLDWRAQFRLVHAKTEVRVDASHGRKGSSIYNPTHGTLREAKFGENADAYITGHTHNFGLFEIEFAEKKHRTWLAQIAGYKVGGLYEAKGGYGQSQFGCSVFMIVHPETGRVQMFSDAEEGADYLRHLRSR